MKITESIRDHLKYLKSLFFENVLVCYGTSLTSTGGWVKLLQKKLPEWYVINSGKGGMNSNWGVDNFKKKVLRYNPKIVLMEFAINDAYEGKPYYSPTGFFESRHNVAKMMCELREKGIKVYYMSMNPPLDMYLYGRNPAQDRPKYWKFKAEHKWIANGSYIDIGKEWEKLSKDDFLFYCPDGLHPNVLASRDITVPKILETLGEI